MPIDQVDVDAPETEMSFWEHLEELRWHIIRILIVLSITSSVAFFYPEIVYDKIILGPKNPDFITYKLLCKASQHFHFDDSFCNIKLDFEIVSRELGEQLSNQFWISFCVGLILAFPYFIWEVWRFVRPALKSTERKYTTGVIFFTSMFMFIGVCFGYFVLTPMAVNFLGNYSISDQVKRLISLESYISLVSTLTLATGLVFELPMLVYFLAKIGILTPQLMRKYRRWAIIIILIVAAAITPPDVVSQTIMSIPLYGLFELSIFIAAFVKRKKDIEERKTGRA
ncbi:MAG: twin-arginine translocase subunit TatC [Bacteroidetes bacterium]|nr:twin-arginine translocase subunit TatC [Bacteroidota bacterium]